MTGLLFRRPSSLIVAKIGPGLIKTLLIVGRRALVRLGTVYTKYGSICKR
jgi:hypothetical protein